MTGLASRWSKKVFAREIPRAASDSGQRKRIGHRTLHKVRLATINIATYRNKEEEILEMIEERKIDTIGMAEMRHWGKDERKDLGGGYTLMYCGTEERGRRHGVAIIVGPRLSHYIQEVKLISERLIKCKIRVKGIRYHIYQVYAPQQGCVEEEKEQFLNTMEEE